MTWQAFERSVYRLLLHMGYEDVRLVGQSHDGGADVIGHRGGGRWLFQVKKWNRRVGPDVIDETLRALARYQARVPVVVSLGGFEAPVFEQRRVLLSEQVPLQLWDRTRLLELARRLSGDALCEIHPERYAVRDYQEEAIQAVIGAWLHAQHKALVVMATGLGKTFVAAEAIRRLRKVGHARRLLVLAHTNELVYQLERAFWPFLSPDDETLVWNGYERPSKEALARAPTVFACINSVADAVSRHEDLPHVDAVIVDECHHAGAGMYGAVLNTLRAGQAGGTFLLGLTATPWRPDSSDIEAEFGVPLYTIDLVTGLKRGFLTNVDYRMFTDNVRWDRLSGLEGQPLSPRNINRTLFITEWDDGVVYELQRVWTEQVSPRAIVFCGTIDHARRMRDRINALGFCRAEAIYSQAPGHPAISAWERGRILADFYDGKIRAVCVVDIFNEGVDVPDVNIIVFQRVTHSRRIFIQQLGRGLRLAPDKSRVIVLDFVSDVRRFAAGLNLQKQLQDGEWGRGQPIHVRLGNRVTFRRVGQDDAASETFLREWLEDAAAVEEAGEDASVLKFPPAFPGSSR